jgi:hypothetical protein
LNCEATEDEDIPPSAIRNFDRMEDRLGKSEAEGSSK